MPYVIRVALLARLTAALETHDRLHLIKTVHYGLYISGARQVRLAMGMGSAALGETHMEADYFQTVRSVGHTGSMHSAAVMLLTLKC